MYYYIQCIIPQSVVFPHKSFRITGSDPQYSRNDPFRAKNCVTSIMFLERIVIPHINKVRNGSNLMHLEHTVMLTCLQLLL
jgi:hypothetical protein